MGILEGGGAGPDGLLATLRAFRSDRRDGKVDLGVGVYKDERGETPVMEAVKAAELVLVRTQRSKEYLGGDGDPSFSSLVGAMALGGADLVARSSFLQTPGGTGALRLAAEVLRERSPTGRVVIGTPCWVNHVPILAKAGLRVETVPTFDPRTQRLDHEALLERLDAAERGDAMVLQASCCNPHGVDPTAEDWTRLADVLSRRGVVPVLDLAYQGLGSGADADAQGLRTVLRAVPEAMASISCSKSFGLYRDRVGALALVGERPGSARGALELAMSFARTSWSMPPDHGAAVVRTILDTASLETLWSGELDAMRGRLRDVRRTFAASLARTDGALATIAEGRGMFSLLPLSPTAVTRLRTDDAIYVAPDGRINLAGLLPHELGRVSEAIGAHLGETA